VGTPNFQWQKGRRKEEKTNSQRSWKDSAFIYKKHNYFIAQNDPKRGRFGLLHGAVVLHYRT
jgi:hypothetical protein